MVLVLMVIASVEAVLVAIGVNNSGGGGNCHDVGAS
jgi:hypothetical protein